MMVTMAEQHGMSHTAGARGLGRVAAKGRDDRPGARDRVFRPGVGDPGSSDADATHDSPRWESLTVATPGSGRDADRHHP